MGAAGVGMEGRASVPAKERGMGESAEEEKERARGREGERAREGDLDVFTSWTGGDGGGGWWLVVVVRSVRCECGV
jgi:hypothetical protein